MGRTFIILLALVASTSAGPIINTGSCSTRCTETKKFGYETGKTYEYDYTTDVDTTVQGASEEKAGVQLTAKVYIDVVSKCEMNLRLDNVRLLESDPKAPETLIDADKSGEFRTNLEKSPLAFSFQDGRIEELCTSIPEKTWVLNIKRGILSAVQNSMDDLTQDQTVQETDITGECKAAYTVSSNGWYSRTIKKSKDLLGCTDRHGYNTMMQGTPYKIQSEIQSLPLIKGTHECSQDISKAGILQSSVCEEEHVLRPFSRESSGAITKTKQTLKYVTERVSSSSSISIGHRVPLTFVHSNDGRGTIGDVMSKLNEICVSTSDSVKPDTPLLFSGLVRLMKALESDDLEQIYRKVKGTRFCASNQKRVEKFFLDAVPMLGTKASLRLITNLINKKEVRGIEANMWLTTLSFIKDPTKEMLNEVKPLISSEDNEEAMLGVSSLVYAYCKTNECENDVDIASIVASIEDKIGVGCYVDKNNLGKVIRSLRSLGNAGFVSNSIRTISNCMTKRENPTEVRLSAIQAFRRMPCAISRDDVMAIFRNKDEDSELRIASYQALMTCPSDNVLSRVRNVLESEEVNQVGSYVWSHLTNLMETSSPLKQEIKNIINDQALKKEFDLEKLKYSRNYEGSFFLEKLNTGASIDSNVVWSSKSFLPRSAMTNITFDLFGHSVNLLEIGGRMEGLEYFLESYFGPNGYFQENDVKEVTKQNIKGISNTKMEDIDRQFDTESDSLKGDLYMRVFGNELLFTRFTGLSDITDGKSINILDILTTLAKKQEYSFTQSYVFLDSSIIIPTMAGFPLNLTIDGSATVDLRASGKMDLTKITDRSPSLSLDGYMKPSGAVQINSMMSVDAFVTKSGIKMVSTMHSSSSFEGHVELKNGKVLSAQIKTPFDKMEVFNVKTAFFTVHRESEREQKMITANRQTKKVCSGDKLAKIIGLELCAELQYPNASLVADAPYFPMTGPVSAGLTLLKRDTHESYNMEYKFVKDKQEARARVAFSTPGSKVDRELSFDCLVRSDPLLEISMISPWKRVSVRGALVGDNQQKQVAGRIVIDDKDEYSVTGEWIRTRKGQLYTYNPYIEIIIPNMENIRLSSSVEYVVGKSFNGELTVKGLSKQPIQSKVNLISKKAMSSIKTSISFEPGKDYSFESRLQNTQTKKATKLMPYLSIRTPKEEVTALGGSMEYKSGSLILVDITLDRLLDKTVKVFTKLTRTLRKSNARYQSKVDIRTPLLRAKGTSNIVLQKTAVITRVNLDYVIPRISRDKITVNSKINYGFTKSVWSLAGKGSLTFKKNADYNVVINTDMNNKARLTKVNFDLRYGAKPKDENKRIFVTSLVRHELGWKKSELDITGDIRHLALGLDLKLKGKHSHNPKSINSNFGLSYGKKQSVSAALVMKNKSKKFTSLTGDVSLKWNDKDFSIANNFEQKNKRRYTNELISNIAGHKTKVVSDLKLSDEEYDVSSDISMSGQKPVHLEALLNLDPRNFRVKSRLNNDYSVEFGSQYKKAALLRLSGDVSVPSRKVKGEFEAKKKGPIYVGHLDIQWDANADKDKQIFVDTQITYNNIQDIDASLVFRSPLQNNKININRKNENAHFDIKSDGKEQLSVDASLKQKNGNDQVKIDGSLTVHTASKGLRYVKLGMNHLSDPSEYKTNFDVNWKPDNQISAAFSLKKPVSIRQLQGSLNIKTPFNEFETSSLEISHDAKDSLKSLVTVQVNKNSIRVDASAKKENNIYLGHAGVKSNIRSIQTISLDFSHQSKDTTNENSLVLNINGNEYRYKGKLTHDRAGLMIQQSGKLSLSSPTSRYDSTWQHSNTLNDITTVITTNINGEHYGFNIKGRHNIAWKEASVQYTLTSTTPFGKGQLMVSHLHRDSSMDTILSMSHNSKNLFTSEGHLKTENGELIATGNLLLKGEQMVAIEGRLKTGSQKYVLVTLSTPFESFRRLRTEMEFKGNTKAMTSSASFELQPIVRRIQLKSTFNRIGGVSGNVRLETQYQQLPASEITFSNRPENDKSRTDIKVEYLPGKIVSLTSRTLLDGQRLSADVSIATPFEKLQRLTAGITHEPTVKGCITKVEMEYPEGKTYYAELAVEYNKNYQAAVTIRLPNYHPVTATLSHKGTWNQFVSGAYLQYDKNGKHQLDISYHNGNSLQGSFTMKSSLVEDTIASFSHSGNRKSINSNILIKYGKNKPINVDIEMTNAKRMKGTLKVASPIMDDITVLFVHKGKSTSFKTKAKIGWGKKEEIEGDLTFNFITNLKADVSISTPFKSIRKMSAFVTHDGNLRDFKCQSELKIGKQVWGANVKSTVDPKLVTELTVNTPHDGYEKMRAAFTHNGQLSNFKCHLEVSKNKKDIIGDLQFTSQPLILSATLQTPVKNYGNLKALLSHDGPLSNFRTQAEITYSDFKTITLDTLVSTNDRLTVSVDIKTPFQEYEEMTAKLSHSGTSNNFASRLETLLQKKRSQFDVSFSSLGPIEGKLTLITPQYEPVRMSLSHSFETSLTNQVSLTYGRKDILNSRISYQNEPKLNGKATFISSFTPDMSVSFEHSGNLRRCVSNIKGAYGKKSAQADLNLSTDKDFSVRLNMKTPFDILRLGELTINHKGQLNDFESTADIDINSQKISGIAKFSTNNGIQGRTTLTTPYEMFHSAEMSFKHSGQLRDFECSGEYVQNGKRSEGQLTLRTSGGLNVRAFIKTPYSEDITLKVNHEGELRRFVSNGELSYGYKTGSAQVSVDVLRDIRINGFLKSPFSRDVVISTETAGKLVDFTSVSQLTYSGQKQHELEISFNAEGSIKAGRTNFDGAYNKKKVSGKFSFSAPKGIQERIEATGHIETPISEPVSISLMFNNNNEQGNTYHFQTQAELTYSGTKQHAVLANFHHAGPLKAFTTSADVTYDTKKSAVQVSFDSNVNIEGKATLKTPFMDDIVLSFGHNGHPLNFKTQAGLTYSGAQQHAVLVNFKHTGVLKAFTTSADITYNTKTASVQVSLESNLNIEGKAIVKTPFTEDIVLSIGHSGQPLNFKTQAALTYSGRKQHDISATFSHDGSLKKFSTSSNFVYNTKRVTGSVLFDSTNGVKSTVSLNTPLTKPLRASFSHNGQLVDFNNQFDVTYGGSKMYEIITDFKFEGELKKFQSSGSLTYNRKTISSDVNLDILNDPEGTVTLRTPFTDDITVSFSHQGTLHNFISHGEIGYNGRKQHEANIVLQNGKKRVFVELSYNTKVASVEATLEKSTGRKGRIEIKSPYTKDIELEVDHRGELLNFNTKGEITISGKKEHEVYVAFEHNGDMINFRTFGEASYNTKKVSSELQFDYTDGIKTKGTLKTPFTNDIEIIIDHKGSASNFKSQADISYSGSKQHEAVITFGGSGKLQKFQLSGDATYNGKKFTTSAKTDFTSGIELEARMSTPFTDDMEIFLDHQGTSSELRSQASATYSGSKQHEIISTLKRTGTLKQFHVSGEVRYNDKLSALTVNMDTTSKVSANVVLQSPISKDIQIEVSFDGTIENLKTKAGIQYGEEKHELLSNFNLDLPNGLEIEIDIQSPIRNMKASVSHEFRGTLKNFRSNIKLTLNDKEINSKTNFDISSGLDITLETPFSGYERNTALLQFSNVQSLISGKAVTKIGKHRTQLNGKIDTSNGLKIELCIKTPLTEDFEVIINGNGGLHAFRYVSSVSYGKEKVRGEVNHEWSSEVFKGNMLLSTPILEDIKIEYDVNGNPKSFGTTVKASIGDMNGIEEITTVRLGEMSIVFDTTLKTTLSGNVKSSQLRFSHDGSISSFKTNIEATHADMTIKADASFKHLPSIEGTLSLQTPFEKLRVVNIKIEQTGSVKSFTTTGSLQYAPDRKLEGRYRHDFKADSLTSSASLALNENRPLINGNLKITQEIVDISLNTPQNRYSVNADMKMKDDTYSLSGNAAIGEKKITIAMEKTPSSININLDTPIKGYEKTQIKASASRKPYNAALNIQTSYLSDIEFDASLTGQRFDELDGSLTLKTGLYNLRNLRISIKNYHKFEELKSHIEAFLTERNGITIDASLTKTDCSLSVSTPWESLRTADGYIKYDRLSKAKHLIVATHMKINQETLYDVDFEFDNEERKEITLIININEPRQLRFELNKLFTSETYMLLKWNKQGRDRSCRMDVKFNSDWSDRKQIVSYRGACGSKSYSIGASYLRPDESSKMVLFIEKDDSRTHGIETIFEKNGQAKYTLQLPSRTVVLSTVSSGYGLSSQVFDFSWDAERDQNKRVVIKTRSDGDELTLGLEMPSLGKDLQLDYKMLIGSGNVIYDGRTAFRYSKDSRKTFTLSSKLEDVSGRGEKYKFLLGISHPYTTVDIQTKAVFGKSNDKLSADFDIQYLTARRQTKNIALITEIDKLKRQLNIQVRSPIKTMKIDARVETSPFKLTIKNLYDDTKPINTELTVDPNDGSLDFNMNYDIKNPDKTLHLNAKFSDEKGISAELFRDVNQKKTVDSLLNLRLKSSKILHTRVHWRPSIISDLKAEITKRIEEYGIRSAMAVEESSGEISKEISYKRRLFQAAYTEEIKSYADAINDKLSELRTLKAKNAFYLQDICNSVDTTMNRIGELSEDLNEAWRRCPVKHTIDEYMTSLEQLQKRLDAYSKDTYISMGGQLNSISTNSYQRLLDYQNYVGNHPTVVNLKSKYNSYMDQLKNMKLNEQWSNVANQYTSSIYNIREGINQRLVNSLPTPMYNMGSSAYKYWEFEENVNALVDKIFDELKKDATKEMSVLKEIFGNVLKSKVIKYDLLNGDIEVDLYLPVDVHTLSSLKDISLRQYIPDMSFPTPKVNFLGSVEDYIPHMSWTASAKVHGRHFTTFDGQEFDFSGRCSYVLARDFVDGNFSIIMNYLGRQKKKLILTSHQQNVQLSPNGKVSVDGVVMDLPYRSSEFAVFSEDDKVVIEGRGFQVKSDPTVNMVDIDLSKWYFGKTGGLLGTLNHERFDDMIMPNKQITSDASALGNAWQVQDRC
ncbi:apolipophorins-like [Mytilus trossulus]|uniref:apolipophorins-like n=1 Tax=Mytilus trossulus TaxID=6551 RepID=UPI003005B773